MGQSLYHDTLLFLLFLPTLLSQVDANGWPFCCSTSSATSYGGSYGGSSNPSYSYGAPYYYGSQAVQSQTTGILRPPTGFYQAVSSPRSAVDPSSINFDSLPYAEVVQGNVQPVAVRYFSQPVPVNMDSAMLRPLSPTGVVRVPVYGIVKNSGSTDATYSDVDSSFDAPARPYTYYRSVSVNQRNNYTPVRPPVRHYSTSVIDDPVQGYHPAYSAWNRQPTQAVFRQSSSPNPTDALNPGGRVISQHVIAPAPVNSRRVVDPAPSSVRTPQALPDDDCGTPKEDTADMDENIGLEVFPASKKTEDYDDSLEPIKIGQDERRRRIAAAAAARAAKQ